MRRRAEVNKKKRQRRSVANCSRLHRTHQLSTSQPLQPKPKKKEKNSKLSHSRESAVAVFLLLTQTNVFVGLHTHTVTEFQLPQLAQFVDPHLLLPLFDFAEHNRIFESEDSLRQQRRRVLAATHLFDALLEVTDAGAATDAVRAARDRFATSRDALQTACAPLLKVLDNATLTAQLKRDKDFHLAYLASNFGVSEAHLGALYRFAYAEFTCGHYAHAGALIGHCQELSAPDATQALEAHWGKLACDILLQRPDEALSDLLSLKDRIEGKASTASATAGGGAAAALEKLHRRTWLAHYALYVCFGHSQGLVAFVDLCMDEKMLQAIQSVCPHLLRYVGAAVILTRRSRREFLRTVERNDDTTLGVSEMVRNAASCGDASDRDPIVVFLRRLFVDYDFEAARTELERCSKMIKADFFLAARHDEFMQNARVLIFESYCRVHQRIALPLLAQKLGMDVEAAERWLVNMIRDARLDAKIDAANNQIVLSPRVLSPHQRVIDKTKGLAFRSSVLLGNLERTRQHKEKSAQAAANDNDE